MVSVVNPVFTEQETMETLKAELDEALKSLHNPYEIIFVDDGDGSSLECDIFRSSFRPYCLDLPVFN